MELYSAVYLILLKKFLVGGEGGGVLFKHSNIMITWLEIEYSSFLCTFIYVV